MLQTHTEMSVIYAPKHLLKYLSSRANVIAFAVQVLVATPRCMLAAAHSISLSTCVKHKCFLKCIALDATLVFEHPTMHITMCAVVITVITLALQLHDLLLFSLYYVTLQECVCVCV